MSDRFALTADSPISAARRVAAITPSDGADLDRFPKAIYIGGAGNVSLIAIDDTDPVTFTGLAAGSVLLVRARRVRATGTTATGLVALL